MAAAVRLDGMTVVDIDAPERRAEILASLGLTGAVTLEATTPRGGAHLYFALVNAARQVSTGGDIKAGRGGYVLVRRFDGEGAYTFGSGGAVTAYASQLPPSRRRPGQAETANGSTSSTGAARASRSGHRRR